MEKSKKVLIIEDDEISCILIKRQVTSLYPDAIINHTKSQKRAIQLLAENKFDLIVVDGKLSDGHGSAIIRFIPESMYEKVIVFTGDETFINESLQKGIFALLKACIIPKLKEHIKAVLIGNSAFVT